MIQKLLLCLFMSSFVSLFVQGNLVSAQEFTAEYESLRQYETPEWFRDAKFGIWSHWGPQCVPEKGDWYARFMYLKGVPGWGTPDPYGHHVATYGHPSEFGYKDLIPLFTAEKWDPEKMMNLYKRAGARYFVSMGQHHDNFDLWDSKLQPWNSVNMGPKRDIVREWQDAAKRNDMKFGVSFHGLRAWSWFEPSRLSDPDGPKKGVPYDGMLTLEDGKGKWWEGYDPRDLYCTPHKPSQPTHVQYLSADKITEQGDKPDEAFNAKFAGRIYDIIENYQPELLYFDSHELLNDPIKNNQLVADFYNASQSWHDGENRAVVTAKHLTEQEQEMYVLDFENSHSGSLREHPWQTDIGYNGWFLSKREHEHRMKTRDVIHTLIDIVSKNGNMLLNICQSADGEIRPYAYEFLNEMGDWMEVNSEAIHGTRPWIRFGEGPSQIEGEKDKQHEAIEYSSEDFRFTTKGKSLYAILMQYPEVTEGARKVTVKSLANGQELWFGEIDSVSLLGHEEPIQWERTDGGLELTLPESAPCDHAYAIRISGK